MENTFIIYINQRNKSFCFVQSSKYKIKIPKYKSISLNINAPKSYIDTLKRNNYIEVSYNEFKKYLY